MSEANKTFQGKSILEVWDWRLSKGSPILYDTEEFWKIVVYANDAPDGERVVLEEIVTDIPTAGISREEGQKRCYPYLYKIRDKYSRDHIEARKPVCKMINHANAAIAALNAEAMELEESGDQVGAQRKRGEMQVKLQDANTAIKEATKALHAEIADGGAS